MKNRLLISVICAFFILCGSVSASDKKFSLVIREGFGTIKVGDVNTTLSSLNTAYDYVRETHPMGCVGDILPLANKFKDWEAEIRYNLWKGLHVGIAVSGATRHSGESAVTYTIFGGTAGDLQTDIETWKTDIRVSAPVKLNLYYSIPIVSKLDLVVNGGIGYYHARITQMNQWQFRFPADDSAVGYDSYDVSGKCLGYHGGLALEYKFNSRFSMSMESQWRATKIRTFKGSISTYADSYDSSGNYLNSVSASLDGILFHYMGDSLRIPYQRHEKMIVENFDPPWYGIDIPSDIRHAFLDLGGFTFKIGLKIGLF